jgi:hypothetical protein
MHKTISLGKSKNVLLFSVTTLIYSLIPMGKLHSTYVFNPLLLRKSGSAGNRTRDLRICSQKL